MSAEVLQGLLQDVKSTSASIQGKTAVFYSGTSSEGISNADLAEACVSQDSTTYRIENTEAGEFYKEVKTRYDAGTIDLTYDELFQLGDKISEMYAQQARGPVIAYLNGAVPTGTFGRVELQVLIDNGNPINGVSSNAIEAAAQGDPTGNLANVINTIGSLSNCFDNGPPPSATAPVTGTDAILADTYATGLSNMATAVSNTTWGEAEAIGAGLVVSGLLVFTPTGRAILAAGVAAFLARTANAETAPEAPSTSNPISSAFYNNELQAYNALQMAPALAEMRIDLLISAGVLPVSTTQLLPDFQASFNALKSTLMTNGNTLTSGVYLSTGQQVNITESLDSAGHITYNEVPIGSELIGKNSAGADVHILSQTGVFGDAGQVTHQFTEFANGTSSLTDSSYNSSGALMSTISLNGWSSSAFGTDVSGNDVINIDAFGDQLTLDSSLNGTLKNSFGTTLASYSSGALEYVGQTSSGNAILGTVGTSGGGGELLNLSILNSGGTFTSDGVGFAASDGLFSGSLASLSSGASSLLSAANSAIGLDTAIGAISNINLTDIIVSQFTGIENTLLSNAESSNTAFGGTAFYSGGALFNISNINVDGAFSVSPSVIATGGLKPGVDAMTLPQDNLAALDGGAFDAEAQSFTNFLSTLSYGPLADLANGASRFANTDPLVLDLTGGGIQISNWINNAVYFDTNLNGAGTAADGQQHHTSWMQSGTGMLVWDPSTNTAGTIRDITQTISQFFAGGSTPYHYADGLAALASLATTGATEFSAATSLINSATGNSYWSEIRIAQGAPDSSGVIQSSQLETLAAAGISSISLVGTGNSGENINGSAVTNRTTYTTTTGDIKQAAAVNFATNTTGDVIVSATGGVTITSTPEGGASVTNSYIDGHTTAQTMTLNGGTLTDSGTTLATGLTAVFATTQNDTITVNSSDTTSYWLGGGAGAATLTGGAGNTMFFINPNTTVHGGTGFNIAQVTGTAPITVDLKTSNLQEVIGGASNGVFNASGTTWNAFIQGGSGNNIIIGGAAHDALSGGTGDDLIEAGPGGSVIHAGSGNDVIYGGSGSTTTGGVTTPNSDIIFGGAGQDTVILGTNNSDVFAGTGNMTVIGSSGHFSVVSFHGVYADYKVTQNSDGSTTVTDKVANRDGVVTLKNVTDLSFSNISQLSPTLNAGLPVNDVIQLQQIKPITMSTAGLLANDINFAGGSLSIANLLSNTGSTIARGSSGAVNGGTAALNSAGTLITFTPTAGFTGFYSFQYNLTGGVSAQLLTAGGAPSGSSAPLSATVTLLAPNEPTDAGLPQEWYLQAADVLPVWAQGITGAGVSVGVFDPSGNVDFTNPDLTPNAGTEYLDTGAPGMDQVGTHATLVAGVIAAANNGIGQVGVAYNATLSSEAITSGSATGSLYTPSLADWANFDVVNNSWGISPPYVDSFDYTPNNQTYFENAAETGRAGLGTINVFSAGNSRALAGNTEQSNSTANPYEITVGGIDSPSDLGALQISGAPFSNPGASILVSAPANNINTTGTVLTNEQGQQFGSATQVAAGTSLSAPIVSGVVALMLEANPNLGVRDVQEILADTAVLVPNSSNFSTTWATNTATNWNGGGMHESYDYGFGEVDAAAAVRLAQTWNQQNTFANVRTVSIDRGASNSITSIQTGTSYNYLSFSGSGALASNETGYTSNSAGLIVPVTSGTAPTIDFNLGTISADNENVEHIEVTVEIAFPGLDQPSTETAAQEQAQLASASALINDLTITLSDGTTTSVLMTPIPTGDLTPSTTPVGGMQTSGGVNIPVFAYTFDTVRDWNESNQQDYKVSIVNATGTPTDAVITDVKLSVLGTTVTSGQGGNYIYTNEYAGTTTLTDTGTNVTLNASPVSTNMVLDARAGSTDSLIQGHTLNIGSTTTNIKTIDGGAGNDTIWANNNGDLIVAGLGNDILHGGTGKDTFQLRAGSGQDKIYAFTSGTTGDVLSLVNPSNGTVKLSTVGDNVKGIVGFDSSGNVVSVNPTGSELSQTGMGSGWTLLSAVDTTGSGASDLVWYNATTGVVDLWAASDTGYIDKGTVDTGLTGTWSAVYSRPSVAGAPAQIMLSQPGGSSGNLLRYLSINNYVVTDTGLYTSGGSAIAGSNGGSLPFGAADSFYGGDFNGDGNNDVLLRWTNGGTSTSMYLWDMVGNRILSQGYVHTSGASFDGSSASLSTDWVVAATTDINGDGHSDILIVDAAVNDAEYWFMGAGGLIGAFADTTIPGSTSSTVIGTADLTGNGEHDVLWKTSTGAIDASHVTFGTTTVTTSLIGTVTGTALYKGASDLNGDGTADLVWQDSSTNAVTIWWSGQQSSATTLSLSTPLASIAALATVPTSTTKITYGISNALPAITATSTIVGVDSTGHVVSVNSAGSETSQTGMGSGWSLLSTVDTTGSGASDLIWYNSTTGVVDLWAANGAGYTDKGSVDSVALTGTWTAVYSRAAITGGSAEIMLSQAGGAGGDQLRSLAINNYVVTDTGLYTSGGSAIAGSNGGSLPFGAADHFYGGDFNGDGNNDVLMRWTNGGTSTSMYLWDMVGNTLISQGYVHNSAGATFNGSSASLSTDWVVAATTDINGDGHSDILIVDASINDAEYWFMGAGGLIASAADTTIPGSTSSTVIGTADLAGDGKQQVLWKTSAGAIDASHVTSGTTVVTNQIGTVTGTALYKGASDLNGDGTADLVWQDSGTNAVTVWWSGQQTNSTTLSLTTPLVSIATLATVIVSTPANSSVIIQDTTPDQLSIYDNITGASTIDDSALAGSLTIDLRIPVGQTADALMHIQNVIANNSGDTIYAAAIGGTLTGGTGNDAFHGDVANDTFIGGGGTNTMVGAGGVDTYKISASDTLNTITNGVSTNNVAAGTVDYLGSTDQNLWFLQSGNNLVVDVLGTTQQTVVQNYFSNTYSQVSAVEDMNGLQIDSSLNSLVTAMASFSTSNPGFNAQTTTHTSLTDSAFYGTLTATTSSSWHA